MLRACSPLFFFFALAVIVMLPLGLSYWRSTRVHHKESGDFDRDTWLLIGLFIAAIASIGLFIFYIFFHTVGC